jgi:hypothetical protein
MLDDDIAGNAKEPGRSYSPRHKTPLTSQGPRVQSAFGHAIWQALLEVAQGQVAVQRAGRVGVGGGEREGGGVPAAGERDEVGSDSA